MTPEAALNFMQSMMNIYVQPEMQRREAEGVPLAEALWAAQIVFQDGNEAPLVRLLARTDDSEEWTNLAELPRDGRSRVREGALVAD